MMVEQFDRLSKYSLNPDNQKMYANKKEQWEKVANQNNVFFSLIFPLWFMILHIIAYFYFERKVLRCLKKTHIML